MKLRIGILAPLILLTGCGLPPALIVASYAADGISYVTYGKSLTDQVLSAAVQRDCALHRVLTGAALCRDDVGDGFETLALAEAPAADESGTIGAAVAPRRSEPRWGPVAALETTGSYDEPAPETVVSDANYVVVGSFSYWVNTERFLQQNPMLNPEVVPATVDGEVVYRVVTAAGPGAVAAAGITQVWPLRLCRDIENVLAPCDEDRGGVVNVAALGR